MLPDFLGASPADVEIAHNMTQIVAADLNASGRFALVDPSRYVERIINTDAIPQFSKWRVIGAQWLVIGRATSQLDGRLKVEFRLWEVPAGQQLGGVQYSASPENWRLLSHAIAVSIYERLTGQPAHFEDENQN